MSECNAFRKNALKTINRNSDYFEGSKLKLGG